jgi:hypothetical protein
MVEISYFAAVLGISLEAAAALLGYRHAAQGGRIPKGESILVGERGPEIFIPRGMVISRYYAEPDFGQVPPGQEWLAYAQQSPGKTLGQFVRPEAWDRWLANSPESENVEDRRSLDNIDMDTLRWRRAHEPKKPLAQFQPATDAHALNPLRINRAFVGVSLGAAGEIAKVTHAVFPERRLSLGTRNHRGAEPGRNSLSAANEPEDWRKSSRLADWPIVPPPRRATSSAKTQPAQ